LQVWKIARGATRGPNEPTCTNRVRFMCKIAGTTRGDKNQWSKIEGSNSLERVWRFVQEGIFQSSEEKTRISELALPDGGSTTDQAAMSQLCYQFYSSLYSAPEITVAELHLLHLTVQ
jgi:hypothetical protein